jgi:hypothetical protein
MPTTPCKTCGGPRDHQAAHCYACLAAQKRAYRAANPERHRESLRRYYYADVEKSRAAARASYARNREIRIKQAVAWQRANPRQDRKTPKDRCRTLFNRAVVSGRLVRPSKCSGCGAAGRIHGHHHDYRKPYDVEWLCSGCHGKRHRKSA